MKIGFWLSGGWGCEGKKQDLFQGAETPQPCC